MKKIINLKEQYFMDDPREGERLEKKVNPYEFVDKYLKKYIDNLSEAKILEAGCGPGVFLRVLGSNYPNHTIKGIDISEDRVGQANIKLAGLNNAKAIKGDIYKLPFPDNYFDFIYSRFLYEYLQHPVAATKELYRVCKPKGKILLQDLDSQFTFYPELSHQLKETLHTLKLHTGFDPNIGRKLFSIGKSAGFSFLNIETEMY
ncbi:MAG: class I SAM-dependent methyltransferase, partial [Ginsengibacter sp.]